MRRLLLVGVLSLVVASSIRAEEVRLKNGDVVLGKVKSLDDTTLILASENFGELKIARERIAVIRFAAMPLSGFDDTGLTAPKAAPIKPSEKAALPNVEDDLAGQLKKLDPTYMKAIEQAFPLLNSSPEAKKYFTDRVEGLMSGKINIEEVRKDAKKVVTELEDLKAELGDETGAALDGYLGILKKFLNETDPKASLEKKAAPKDYELESPEQLKKKVKEIEEQLKLK
jgi:hypothetical protein